MLPLMPTEVFDEWLGGLIALQGWPFQAVTDDVKIEHWSRQLLELPLTEWASFVWEREDTEDVDQKLAKDSIELVMELRMHAMPWGSGADGVIRDSKDRYRKAVVTMIEIKGFPGFVTAVRLPEDAGKLTVVDGHHRLAALGNFRGFKRVPVPFWIAQSAPRK